MIIFLHLVTFGACAILGALAGWRSTRRMRGEVREYLSSLYGRAIEMQEAREKSIAALEAFEKRQQERWAAKPAPSASNPPGWPMKFVTTGSAGSSPPPVLWQGLEDRRESGAGDAVHGASGPPSAGPDELAGVTGDPEG